MSQDAPGSAPVQTALRVAGAALVWAVIGGWALTRGRVLITGHPAMGVLLGGSAIVALAVPWSAWRGRSRPQRRLVTIALVLGAVLTAVLLVALRPYPAQAAAAALATGTPEVGVHQTATRYELVPLTGPARSGLVFHPGALVDPAAYLPLLLEIAAHGHVVEVVKPPLGFALLSGDGVDAAARRHPQVQHWSVGGHSLGGVAAARQAAAHADSTARVGVEGLLLWASYPAAPLPSALAVTSIYGTRDTVLPAERVLARRADLPADASLVPINGGVHAYFGDYGSQRGDGTPQIDRRPAQQQIVAASVQLLDRTTH